MRSTTDNLSLVHNYLQHYRLLIKDYELVKQKRHPQFRFVNDFYRHHGTCRQTFLKYYNRFKQQGKPADLLPQKRGPRYKTRRPLPFIEEKVKHLRLLGNNRYEIVSILKPQLKRHTPSASGVYNICKRLGLHRLTPAMKQTHRTIIKQKVGELGHIDCHYLSKTVIKQTDRWYLVCVLDDHSRVAWAEVIPDITSLTVMFAVLKCFNILTVEYQIKFAEVLTDNGPEFGTRQSKKKPQHPFERMLLEMGIKHRYIRPYRPQTNGKVERFWRTLEADLLQDTQYDNVEALKEELLHYLIYYNTLRPHQGIMGLTPATKANQNLSSI